MAAHPADSRFDPGRLFGNRRRLALFAVAAILLAAGVVFLVGKLAGFGRLWDALQAADWHWLPICLAGQVASYAGYTLALRLAACAEGGPRLGLGLSARLVFTSLGASRVAAGGGAGGLAVDYWALRRAGVGRDESVVRVLALNTLLYGWFGALAWVAALLLLLGIGGDAPLGMILPWLAGVSLCMAAAVFVSRREVDLARSEGRHWLRRGLDWAMASVVLVRRIIARRQQGGHGVGGACLYWVGDIACLWAALRAFGLRVGLAALVLAYVTGYLASLLPLPTGAEGGIEAAMTFALHATGIALAPALLGVLAYRAFSFWLPILPAAVMVARIGRLARDLDAVGRGERGGEPLAPAAGEPRPA